jgi:hypothetical protein
MQGASLIDTKIQRTFLDSSLASVSLFLSACSVQHHLLQNAGDLLSKESSNCRG